jgi:TonB family protein
MSTRSSATVSSGGNPPAYQLHSDLAQFCLPAANLDANRKFAWANSICVLFLIIGAIGIKMPVIVMKPLAPPTDIVPVVFTPPVDQPPPEPNPEQMDEPDRTEVFSDAPVVATVVAADAATVGFAVPVEGPVVFAPAKFASAPPPPSAAPKPASKPKPIEFRPGANDGGFYPPAIYPPEAQRAKPPQQGKGTLYVVVDANGTPTSVEIKDGSGYSLLDRCALDQVKRRWRWPPGQDRLYYVPFEFKLQ